MKTKATEMLDIDLPIFGFSHCRDVVAELSKAGGFGVLGAAYMDPEALEQELRWIDENSGGKPYGVNLVMPAKSEKNVISENTKIEDFVPKENIDFVDNLLEEANIPDLPEDLKEEKRREVFNIYNWNPERNDEMLEVVYRHPNVKLIVSALGSPAKHHVEKAHSQGIKVAALAGNLNHAMKHKEAGVDLVIAQGHEAAGHTGQIGSMVLWPELAEALDPIPVLAAGGVGRGNQIAAALAMGTAGVWCGSIWLATRESELTPEEREVIIQAKSEDTILSRHLTGKPSRMIRDKATEAWVKPGVPKTLGLPHQTLFWRSYALPRIHRAKSKEYMAPVVGQIVGQMNKETTVKRVVEELLEEFVESMERLNNLMPS